MFTCFVGWVLLLGLNCVLGGDFGNYGARRVVIICVVVSVGCGGVVWVWGVDLVF